MNFCRRSSEKTTRPAWKHLLAPPHTPTLRFRQRSTESMMPIDRRGRAPAIRCSSQGGACNRPAKQNSTTMDAKTAVRMGNRPPRRTVALTERGRYRQATHHSIWEPFERRLHPDDSGRWADERLPVQLPAARCTTTASPNHACPCMSAQSIKISLLIMSGHRESLYYVVCHAGRRAEVRVAPLPSP